MPICLVPFIVSFSFLSLCRMSGYPVVKITKHLVFSDKDETRKASIRRERLGVISIYAQAICCVKWRVFTKKWTIFAPHFNLILKGFYSSRFMWKFCHYYDAFLAPDMYGVKPKNCK